MARTPQAARRRPNPTQAVPTGLWVMLGVVVLLFVGILIWLGSRPEQPPTEAKNLPLQAPAKPAPSAGEGKAAQKDVREVRTDEAKTKPPVPPPPRYDFYQMLPQQSVGTPAPAEPAAAKAPAPSTPQPSPVAKAEAPAEARKEVTSLPPATVDVNKTEPASSTQVSLQVGSFRRYEEADRRKAELALLGYAASVQTANVNGETWHRVKIGPLPDAEARKVRDRLKAVGMNPMLIKGS